VTSITAGEAGVGAAGGLGTAPAGPTEGGEHAPVDRPVHRLRDLGRRERLWVVAVAAALLLAPVMALALFVPEWTPANDPALMGLRALDTGTLRTPLLGQPSQSGLYADSVASVHHPGPLHFYVMAVPIRLLGGAVGMPLVSVLITGSCLAVSAWAVFRQLGRTAGLVAAAALALVTFTTGASSLVNPVSSSIAGYPLLCSAVLLWCVAAGDIRLLPLATGVVSFTAQQHLSVVPATAVLTTGGLVLLALTWRREGRWRDRASRRDLARWGRRSGLVALVLWAPVLLQQVAGNAGNLSEMVWFARHGNRETLGYGSAVGQVARALGLPPLLGRTDLTGAWLLDSPSALTWASAAAVLAGVAAVCLRWRTADPRRASLGSMLAVVVVAGLVNGASVPDGLEQTRLAFYHWAFALAFFVTLVLGLAVAVPVYRIAASWRPAARPALAALAVVVVALPGAINPGLDRRTNTARAAYSPVDHAAIADLADGIEAHADQLGEHVLLISRHEPPFTGIAAALSFELAERGIEVRHPLTDRFFVHDQRLVDRELLDGGLVLVVDTELAAEAPPGALVAEADLGTDLDVDAYRSLVATARAAGEVVPGPAVERALQALPDENVQLMTAVLLAQIADEPEDALLQTVLLEFVRDHPLVEPAFDPDDIDRVLATLDALDGDSAVDRLTGLRVFLLDRDDMLDVAWTHEVGRADDRPDD
jgi:hypothetical protein